VLAAQRFVMTMTDRPDAGSPPGDSLDRPADQGRRLSLSRGLAAWIMVLALPLAALGLLLAEPDMDMLGMRSA
jgi:hypothetical protein